MDEMNITEAQYTRHPSATENENIRIIVDGVEMFAPLAPGNRHYDEIMRQVAAGTLTIQEAD